MVAGAEFFPFLPKSRCHEKGSVPIGAVMLVNFVTDEPSGIPAIRAMLEPRHRVARRLPGAGAAAAILDGVPIIDADLRKPGSVGEIKPVVRSLRRGGMDGKLEKALVKAFGSVALKR